MQYAKDTNVSVEKSRAEIETTLRKYGADQFGYAEDSQRGLAQVHFTAKERHIRFILSLPSRNEKQFQVSPRGRARRSELEAYKAWEQACRQRWRALCLCIKAKLEAVECGIAEFENEFMANIVLPGGKTVGEMMKPQIKQAYLTGDFPPGIAGMLPHSEPTDSDAVSDTKTVEPSRR